jgi:hypothetical protein
VPALAAWAPQRPEAAQVATRRLADGGAMN